MENLSGGELRFLDFIKGKTEQENFSPRWECLYDVSPVLTLQKLISEGYLVAERDYEYNMTKSTVADLKYVLREYGLKVSGKKSELIERLKDNVDKSILESEFDCKRYHLTRKGTETLEKYSAYILNVKNSMGFSLEEVKDVQERLPADISSNPHDVLWGLLNSRKLKNCMDGNWGLYRNDLMAMGNLLYTEHRYYDCLPYFLSVFYIDVSGMGNGNTVDDYKLLMPMCMSHNLRKVMSEIDETPENICEMLNAYVDMHCKMLPFRYFSDEIVKKILLKVFKGEEIDLSNYSAFANRPDSSSLHYNTYSSFCSTSYSTPKYKYADYSDNHKPDISSKNSGCFTLIMAFLIVIIVISFTAII